jgi:hypothetical protein
LATGVLLVVTDVPLLPSKQEGGSIFQIVLVACMTPRGGSVVRARAGEALGGVGGDEGEILSGLGSGKEVGFLLGLLLRFRCQSKVRHIGKHCGAPHAHQLTVADNGAMGLMCLDREIVVLRP